MNELLTEPRDILIQKVTYKMRNSADGFKGSEWKKWDLHIHTPASIIQQYGGSDDKTWDKFIDALERLPEDIKVIGITDYYFIDGYEKVMSYKIGGRLTNIEKIFPILEFRIDTFGSGNENKLQKINLHILFDINEGDINNEIKKIKNEFIGLIPITRLAEHKTKMLSKENLAIEGRTLQHGFSDLIPPTDEVFKLIEDQTWENKTFLFLGYKEWSNLEKNNQLKPLKKDLYGKVDAFLGSNLSTCDKIQGWLNKLGKKRLLYSGDIHDFNNLKVANKDNNGKYICNTWIKADTTFEGLKQIIYEPEERVFIGETPTLLERVHSNKIKFIQSISITQTDGYKEDKGIWFNNIDIPLNYGMVSITGNKGNGKSALADIIGLCGDAHHYKDFSFLNKSRFLKDGLAKNFEAKLKWANNENISKNLYEKIDDNAPERVRYLPQSFFYKLTNDLDSYNFKKTLEDIVFSYLPEEEKLRQNSFEDLIKYKEENINKDIEIIANKIKSINDKLIKFENNAHPEYKDKLEKELGIKKKELEEHLKNKPQEIKNPDSDKDAKEQNQEISTKLSEKNSQHKVLETNIIEKRNVKISLKLKIEDLLNIKQDIIRLEDKIKLFKSSSKDKLKVYELNIDEILKYEINLSGINELLEKQETEYDTIFKELLSEEQVSQDYPEEKHKILKEKSLICELSQLKIEIKQLKGELSAPYRTYQDYLAKLSKWEKDKLNIIGDERTPQTINWYGFQIKYIEEELPKIIEEQRTLRIEKSIAILNEKLKLVDVYSELKKSVDNKVTAYKDILKDYDINIDVVLKLNLKFTDNFLSYINQNKTGSFYQKDQGKMRIDKIIENINFQETDKLRHFLKEVIDSFGIDKRDEHKNATRYISEQINTEKLLAFYNYLFSISYLEPSYELKLGDKHLTELSPGEKGAMLIVFYLMLDKDNIPLIIDQPEENLDNESIYKILVHFIKDTKRRRQVILVTHNPNLAIVGDSEQIIYVSIDKKNKNKFTFKSGSIENPEINKYASKILEGTIEAFDIRKLKYFTYKNCP